MRFISPLRVKVIKFFRLKTIKYENRFLFLISFENKFLKKIDKNKCIRVREKKENDLMLNNFV